MHQHFRLADHVSLTTLDDEAVLLNLNTGAYFGLNHVGLALIESLNQGHSQVEAVEVMAKRYLTDKRRVADDTQCLIEEMLEHQLIEVV